MDMRMSRRVGRVSLLAILVLVAGLFSAGLADATSPGPNGRIAFADFNTGQIYSINPDGTGLRQLTQVPEGAAAGQPDWSPDGRHIAFFLDLSGEARLYVMDRDGSHQHLVFNEQEGHADLNPTYTPDGNRLVFSRCQTEGVCAIYSVRLDGTHLQALTRFKPSLDVFDVDPTVSPDGARIAFTRFNAGGIVTQVYVMRADGSGARPITPPALEGFAPDWTPNGRHVLVTSNSSRLGGAIYQANPDGGGVKPLTRPPFPQNDILPSSSPQGDRIVFSSDRLYPDLCCRQMYTVRADGNGLRRLETDLVGVTAADWGSAPADTTTATPAATGRSLAATRAPASAAKFCVSRPDLLLLGRCGTPQHASVKRFTASP
jgi:Tol biopolymer transport system component